MEPLVKFFHDSVDFERIMEINRQELILQDDFSIYQLFTMLTDDGKGAKNGLSLVNFQTNLNKFFNVKFSYKDIKLALIRQFPISYAGRIENMRYPDFESMMKPRNRKFASYVARKMKLQKDGNAIENIVAETGLGIQGATHVKLGKFFDDLLQKENDIEMSRKYKLSQINIKDAFKCFDVDRKGYATLEDYFTFFEEYYTDEMPITTEEIEYLFRRHDKEKIGRVTEAVFLKELMPLDDYIVID